EAALELAEAFTFISEEGISDDLYNRVGAVFTEKEYAALSWACVSINAFNRVVIAGRYPVPPRAAQAQA
ncbi:carboxymuconolactone decarboxylase family protein, partial [Microbacterium sp. ISL-103]|nr:carboxymuconolactone decarboxylase family protein [Microbacterium sp. ISL-103]